MRDGRDRREDALANQPEHATRTAAQKVLAVAVSPQALSVLPRHVLPPESEIARTTYEALADVALSGRGAPALVLSPLLTPAFDALDLARRLGQGGYRGRYLALVDRLPNADLIRREVAAQTPAINFDVIVLDGSTPLHSL